MKRKKKILYTALFLLLIACILSNSKLSLFYAYTGLELWYANMIPTLLPFMILSGIMIRMGLTEGFSALLYPLIRPVYRVSRNVCYAMIIGFFCGFPMGARTVADLYERQMITEREAAFLLAFCNNIGPVYFLSFVLPLLNRKLLLPYLFGMYGLPLLYGAVLRYTMFRDLSAQIRSPFPGNSFSVKQAPSLLEQVDDAIHSSIQNMLMLGGYMILFNLLNLLPHILWGHQPVFLAPLFEISGGLKLLGQKFPLYSLLLLPFGGLSCIAQTYSCIKDTPLSIADYTLHKLMLTGLTAVYYLCWLFLSPGSFLR